MKTNYNKNINNLSHTRCYIAGPIEYQKNKNEKYEYMKSIIDFLQKNEVNVLDPQKIRMNGVSEISDRKKMFDENNFNEIRRQAKIIVRKDLRCIDISDFIIAYLPSNICTVGTIHEIIESDRQKKPTLILCPQGKKNIPLWLYGIIPLRYMFESIDEILNYLKKINENDKIIQYDDRWQFTIKHITDEILNI